MRPGFGAHDGRRQALYQPRVAPKLNWPILEQLLCPFNRVFAAVADEAARSGKMAVQSDYLSAIVRHLRPISAAAIQRSWSSRQDGKPCQPDGLS
jgi:hypothetical protein